MICGREMSGICYYGSEQAVFDVEHYKENIEKWLEGSELKDFAYYQLHWDVKESYMTLYAYDSGLTNETIIKEGKVVM